MSYPDRSTSSRTRRIKKGGENVTDMKRITVSFPDNIVRELERLKKTKKYATAPYSMIIRDLVQRGLEKAAKGGTT